MSKGLEAIRARRAHLVQRAAVERDEVAARFEDWRGPLAVVDWGLTFIFTLQKSAPLIGTAVGIGAAALAIARPRSIASWIQGGLAAWRAVQRVRGLLRERHRPA